MNKTLIFVLLTYGIFFGNISAQNPNKPTDILIESVNGTAIYAGFDNVVKIICPGLNLSDYVVTTDKGVIIRTSKELYKLKPPTTGLVTVQVLVKGKVQQKKIFQAIPIPNPQPLLGSFRTASDTVKLGKFKDQTGIRLAFENAELNGKCDLISFSITKIGIQQSTGTLLSQTARNKGSKFDGDASRLMASAGPGDIYIFNDITIKCPGDIEKRVLSPLVYFIENNID
ncbi:MAG: hypothetical protein IT261_09825 [Saprospiraceae bacterium]|nr:hypothetical protein [Saprospiraceae bacterium]